MGATAKNISEDEALRRWNRDHPPSPRILDATLKGLGFQPVEDTKHLHRALRTLPLNTESENSFWLSHDRQWVVYFDEAPRVYSSWNFHQKPKPKASQLTPPGWDRAGAGWAGFDQLLRGLENTKKSVKSPIPARMTPRREDPRAIRY